MLTALGMLFTNYEMGESKPHEHLAKLTGLRSDFSRSSPDGDKLYRSTYQRVNDVLNCDQCSFDQLVVRVKRSNPSMQKQTKLELNELMPSISVLH